MVNPRKKRQQNILRGAIGTACREIEGFNEAALSRYLDLSPSRSLFFRSSPSENRREEENEISRLSVSRVTLDLFLASRVGNAGCLGVTLRNTANRTEPNMVRGET